MQSFQGDYTSVDMLSNGDLRLMLSQGSVQLSLQEAQDLNKVLTLAIEAALAKKG